MIELLFLQESFADEGVEARLSPAGIACVIGECDGEDFGNLLEQNGLLVDEPAFPPQSVDPSMTPMTSPS
jgi:hypothetical protein